MALVDPQWLGFGIERYPTLDSTCAADVTAPRNLVVIVYSRTIIGCFDRKNLIHLLLTGTDGRISNYTRASADVVRDNPKTRCFQLMAYRSFSALRPMGLGLEELIERNGKSLGLKPEKSEQLLIASGTYGSVSALGDSGLAVKTIRGDGEITGSLLEIFIPKILGRARCCLITPRDFTYDATGLYLTMKLGTPAPLVLGSSGSGGSSIIEIKTVLYQLLQSVYEMHRLGVVNYDIKVRNLLGIDSGIPFSFGPNSRIAITDWGIAQFCPYARRKTSVGTPTYSPLECRIKAPQCMATEMFMVGATMVALMISEDHYLDDYQDAGSKFTLPDHVVDAKFPYSKTTGSIWTKGALKLWYDGDIDLLEKLIFPTNMVRKYNMAPGASPRDRFLLQNLIDHLCCSIPEERLTVTEAMNHPFFSEVKDSINRRPIEPITDSSILSELSFIPVPGKLTVGDVNNYIGVGQRYDFRDISVLELFVSLGFKRYLPHLTMDDSLMVSGVYQIDPHFLLLKSKEADGTPVPISIEERIRRVLDTARSTDLLPDLPIIYLRGDNLGQNTILNLLAAEFVGQGDKYPASKVAEYLARKSVSLRAVSVTRLNEGPFDEEKFEQELNRYKNNPQIQDLAADLFFIVEESTNLDNMITRSSKYSEEFWRKCYSKVFTEKTRMYPGFMMPVESDLRDVITNSSIVGKSFTGDQCGQLTQDLSDYDLPRLGGDVLPLVAGLM